MNEQTLKNCELLIENRDKIKTVFAWDGGLMHLTCAEIYLSKGKKVDINVLENCKKLLKSKVGVFSTFRGTVASVVATMLAVSETSEETLENGIKVYELLKKHFYASDYLPIAAMAIAQMTEPYQYEQIALRTRALYDMMKKNHPFLTAGEDSAFCALMALSEKTDTGLIADAEQCYRILKAQKLSSNAVQSLSNVLALCEGTPEEKCEKTLQLFDKFKAAGHKYGTEYELSTLGVLAMTGENLDAIVQDTIEIDEWLSKQKGFGFWGGLTGKQRLMYAGILAQKDFINPEPMQTAAVGSTVAFMVAQQTAMCAVMAGTVAATTSAAVN